MVWYSFSFAVEDTTLWECKMNVIPINEAIGTVLAHDITRIVPGVEKGLAFKKGHIIRGQDIPVFHDIGKEHVYVLELKQGDVHEDEAALRIATAATGPGLKLTPPSEGRVNLVTEIPGLLKVNAEALNKLNLIEDIAFAALHSNQQVDSEKPVAGTRIIPLLTTEQKIEEAEGVCREYFPVVQVLPFKSYMVGLVTTGSEVFHGRIQDKFGPVVRRKFEELGSSGYSLNPGSRQHRNDC